MSASYRRIPYGVANFYDIRSRNQLYVDKTRFIRNLEEYNYVFLIRPRRFGKSCWVSVLSNYYDRNQVEKFEMYFGGLDIGKAPTEERNRYVVIWFDFSVIDKRVDMLEESFEVYGDTIIGGTCKSYPDLFPKKVTEQILGKPNLIGKLNELFNHTQRHNIPVYLFIDEYDNFANVVLADHGQTVYHQFTHSDGFYRNFFAMLKGSAGKGEGGLKRLFITGVSPITMDDVTSGFNVGKNISMLPEFNEMLGFTEEEVHNLLKEYQDLGVFDHDLNTTLKLMKEWYNGYRFSKGAANDLYNPDMVLYYLLDSIPNKPGPQNLIDTNIRIDYGKLRHLMWVNRQLNGNFNLLKSIIENGSVTSHLMESFPLKQLTNPENFISLLYYFGLLSIAGSRLEQAVLRTPNRTVSELMYGYLRAVYQEGEIFRVSLYQFSNLINDMALAAAWKPVFMFLADAIKQQTSIRDYLAGEKMIQGFLVAYLNVTNVFLCHTEWECAKGYVDLYLEPFRDQYKELHYGFLIELKYLKRGDSLSDATLSATVAEANSQMRQYLQDAHFRNHPEVQFIGILLVFHGWEMVVCETVETEQ